MFCQDERLSLGQAVCKADQTFLWRCAVTVQRSLQQLMVLWRWPVGKELHLRGRGRGGDADDWRLVLRQGPATNHGLDRRANGGADRIHTG